MDILIFYGSYRSDRVGIRAARWLVGAFEERGDRAELVDAKAVGLPMLDRMYKEYDAGKAPEAMERLAGQIRGADAFVFVAGEYNQGLQPGLKNLTDHFLEEWFWRPAGIVSYSAKRTGGARAGYAWRPVLGEMGMAAISSSLELGDIGGTLDEEARPTGKGGEYLEKRFPRFAEDLAWWAEAAKAQKARRAPPY